MVLVVIRLEILIKDVVMLVCQSGCGSLRAETNMKSTRVMKDWEIIKPACSLYCHLFVFFQACRGDKLDEGILVADGAEYDPFATMTPTRLPVESDVLIYYSSVAGEYTFELFKQQ